MARNLGIGQDRYWGEVNSQVDTILGKVRPSKVRFLPPGVVKMPLWDTEAGDRAQLYHDKVWFLGMTSVNSMLTVVTMSPDIEAVGDSPQARATQEYRFNTARKSLRVSQSSIVPEHEHTLDEVSERWAALREETAYGLTQPSPEDYERFLDELRYGANPDTEVFA